MRYDIECPYCGEGQDINHDDGYGYKEDYKHQQLCYDCNRTFVFTTSIHYYYEADKADCLQSGVHEFVPTKTFPREYTEMQCSMCDETRPCTPEELSDVLSTSIKKNG